jgi:hypothetical protein
LSNDVYYYNVTITGCIVENITSSGYYGNIVYFVGYGYNSTLNIKNTAFKNISGINYGSIYVEGTFKSVSIFFFLHLFNLFIY